MNCPNCGVQLPEGSTFCGNCGNSIATAAPAENTASPASAEKKITFAGKTISLPKNIIKIAGIAVAAVIVLVLIISLFSGGYKKTAKKYMQSVMDMNYTKMAKLVPYNCKKLAKDLVAEEADAEDMSKKEVYEEISDDFDVKVRKPAKILAAAEKYTKKEFKESLKDEDIKGYKVKKIKVNDVDKLDKDEVKDAVDEFEEMFEACDLDIDDYMKTKKIKKGYYVEVEAEIKYRQDGDKEEEESEETFTVVKYGGKWVVLDETLFFALTSICDVEE